MDYIYLYDSHMIVQMDTTYYHIVRCHAVTHTDSAQYVSSYWYPICILPLFSQQQETANLTSKRIHVLQVSEVNKNERSPGNASTIIWHMLQEHF